MDMRLLVPLTAALVPLLIAPGLLTYFDVTPKIAFLLSGTALILLYRAENVRNLRGLLSTRTGQFFAVLLAVEWFASAVATAFSSHPALSLNGGNWRRFGLLTETALLVFLLLAAAWLAANASNIRTLLRATTAAGALASLYGIAQYFGWDPLLPAKAYQAGEGPFTIVRPPGTLGHADYFAAWLAVVLFTSYALSGLEEARWAKMAALATVFLAGAAIVLSGTRSALIGLLAGVIVLVIAGRFRFRLRAAGWLLVCLAGVALFFFSPAGGKLRARLHWSLEDIRGGARLLLWRDSARMAVQRPWAGFGPETFATEFPRFQSVELARAYPDFYHESPHNMFLDALTSRGLVGLLPLLALCALGVWESFRLVHGHSALGPPLAAAFAAVLVSQQFVVFIVPTALAFYLVLAFLIAGRSATTAASASPTWWYAVLAWPLAAILALFAIQLVGADVVLAQAERRIAAQDASGAAQTYRTFRRWTPAGSGSDLRYSRDMQQLSASAPLFATSLLARQEAFKAAIDATRSAEDRQNAWYNLATLFAEGNDAVSVERCLRNSIAWAPNWFKPHWTLAQLLQATGRHEQALQEAARAVELDGGHDAEVTKTRKQLERLR